MNFNKFIENLYKTFIIYNDLLIGVLISVIVVIISLYFITKYNTMLSMKLFNIWKPTKNNINLETLNGDSPEDDEEDEYFDEQRVLDNNTNISEILSHIKAAKFKAVEKTLSDDQIKTEREIERQQLANIFELLKKQEQEYNLSQMKEEEFQAQLHLYR